MKPQLRTQYDLMNACAEKLANKPVLIRLKKPATKGNTGECHRSPGGMIIIDIRPGLSNNDLLFVYCHEVAHAKLHNFARSKTYEKQPESLQPDIRTKVYNIHEDQAETQAAEWLRYAKENRDPTLPFLEGALFSLYNREQ